MNTILIGLAIVIGLIIIGKIFSILTKIFFVILLVIALTVGFYVWQNNNTPNTGFFIKTEGLSQR